MFESGGAGLALGAITFAVMDCASVVHGKLMWEGKLIAAAIQALLGVRLTYEYSGQGEQRKVVVTGILDDIKMSIEGTVSDWKTSGSNSPWEKLANRDQMLAYRGARQWARRYAPEVILGVYAQDEFEDLEPRNVSPSKTLARLETPNIPGRKPAPADAIPATYEAAAEVVAPSDPVTILPTGKQTLVRHERDAKLKSVTEKTSDKGLRYFEVATAIAGKSIVLTTFSTTDGEALQQLDPGAMIRAVVVKSGDLLTLEAFTMIANEEGLV